MSATEASLYELGKGGAWQDVFSAFEDDPALARRAVRYAKPRSGWTLLHQAAYWGDEAAIKKAIEYGARVDRGAKDGETPTQVAMGRGHSEAVELLGRALEHGSDWWAPVEDPDMMPASNDWDSARKTTAKFDMQVVYAGTPVFIGQGRVRYADAFNRTLVGWHGTFDPPRGMDGDPQIDTQGLPQPA